MKKLLSKLFNFVVNIPKDKLLHFIAGLLISEVVISVLFAIFNPFYGEAIIGFAVGTIFGIAKEIYDKYHAGHSVEFKDCLYTILGSAIGSLIMFVSIL